MSPQQVIDRERRWAPYAVVCALLAFGLTLGALVIISYSGIESGDLLTDSLRAFDEHSGKLLFANILSAIGTLLIGPVLLYLYMAAYVRADRMRSWYAALTILGPLLLALRGLLGALGQGEIASDFVSQSAGVGDIYTLAENLIDESGLFQVARALFFPGLLILIFMMVYVPLWSVRVGLMPRFAGTFGMAIGAMQLFLPPQIGVLILMLWFGYVALLIANRIPGGRPPAWDAGRAVPWDDSRGVKGSPEPATVVEGDAREIPGVGESPHAARRERAKRRKRKRRQ